MLIVKAKKPFGSKNITEPKQYKHNRLRLPMRNNDLIKLDLIHFIFII